VKSKSVTELVGVLHEKDRKPVSLEKIQASISQIALSARKTGGSDVERRQPSMSGLRSWRDSLRHRSNVFAHE
jgi:hypothetical protein